MIQNKMKAPAKGKKNQNTSQRKPSKSTAMGPTRAVPLAQSRTVRTQVPSITGSPFSSDGRIRIKHREYIRDLPGSVLFSALSFSVNPGLATTFPWLSTIAANYESYRFLKLDFSFETSRSASTDGRVILAIDFDASDLAPVSKTELLSYHNAVSSAAWEECVCASSRQDLDKFGIQRFIRSGTYTGDVKTFDIGNFFAAAQGCLDTSIVGELYVTYDVELMTPQTSLASFALANCARVSGISGITNAAYLGTTAQVSGGLNVTGSGNTITFNRPGQYIVVQDLMGTVFLEAAPANTGTATATVLSLSGFALRNAAATRAELHWRVQVNNVGETLITDFSAQSTTITGSIVRISPYNYALN